MSNPRLAFPFGERLGRSFALLSVAVLLGCGSLCPEGTRQSDDRCVPVLGHDGGPVADAGLDAGNDPADAALEDAGPGDAGRTCGVCVPPTPSDWTGPLIVNPDADESAGCPSAYPTPREKAYQGLNASPASCSCGCVVDGVQCRLSSTVTGRTFTPMSSCASPETRDDCLEAEVDASCSTNASETIPPPSWTTTVLLCGGAEPAGECATGSCFPSPDDAPVCIYRDGDHACPGGFDARTLYHRGLSDTRSCTACTCNNSGARCTIELEICSLGFYDVTLVSGGGDHCLNSSDGDGVTLLGQAVTAVGTCSTSGGSASGSASPIDPVTVCCMP